MKLRCITEHSKSKQLVVLQHSLCSCCLFLLLRWSNSLTQMHQQNYNRSVHAPSSQNLLCVHRNNNTFVNPNSSSCLHSCLRRRRRLSAVDALKKFFFNSLFDVSTICQCQRMKKTSYGAHFNLKIILLSVSRHILQRPLLFSPYYRQNIWRFENFE